MGNQPSKSSSGTSTPRKTASSTSLDKGGPQISSQPSFTKSDTVGSTRSFKSLRYLLPTCAEFYGALISVDQKYQEPQRPTVPANQVRHSRMGIMMILDLSSLGEAVVLGRAALRTAHLSRPLRLGILHQRPCSPLHPQYNLRPWQLQLTKE